MYAMQSLIFVLLAASKKYICVCQLAVRLGLGLAVGLALALGLCDGVVYAHWRQICAILEQLVYKLEC